MAKKFTTTTTTTTTAGGSGKKKSKAATGKKKEGKKATPPVREKKVGLTIGKTSGVGVVETWNKLLKANAKAKLTDEQLMDAMAAEFPDREKFQPVARVRSWYNNGRYNLGLGDDKKQLPENRSVPYDKDGNKMKRVPFGGKDRATLKAKKRAASGEKAEAA